MKNDKYVLIFISSFYPAHKNGGPLLSISNYLSLGLRGVTFKVVTKSLASKSVQTNTFQKIKSYEVLTSNSLRIIRLQILKDKPDIYYLNSLFDFKYSIAIILMRSLGMIPNSRILIAPRGELAEGALSLKTFKKRIFLTIARLLKMYNGVVWHASSLYEKDEIIKEYGENITVKIARDIPNSSLQNVVNRKRKVARTIKIIFISRIDRKKIFSIYWVH